MERCVKIIVGCIMVYSTHAQAPLPELEIQSGSFEHNTLIPEVFTCQGKSVSPQLSWTPVSGARSYALIVEDPDAPAQFLKPHDKGAFTHWIAFNIPADITQLDQGAKLSTLGAQEGPNSSNKQGYTGPCPPSGTHRYFFRVYALDIMLDPNAGNNKEKLLKAMEGHILAQGELIGLYKKQ